MTSRRKHNVRRIVSGGQSGVDRGALDAAISMGIEHGGWCPRGRLAEDGPISPRYRLVETKTPLYRERTERNVVDSDGTLILFRAALRGGTELTRRLVVQHAKPHLLVDLDQSLDIALIRQWLLTEAIEVLNVAGPRESSSPGIGNECRQLIREIFVDHRRPHVRRAPTTRPP